MIATDIGDDRHQRRDHIGGVEPSTQAGFQNHCLDPLLGKPEQGEDGGELEIGGAGRPARKVCQPGDQLGKIGW